MSTQVSFKVPWGKLRGLSLGNRCSPNKYICIHGWQDNAALYRPLISNLPPDNHYIALDLMGHGKSDPLPTGMMYNFTNWAYALHHVVDQLALEKVNLIGHSLGGGVTGYYSSIFPEKVNQLILFDSAGMPMVRDDYRKHTRTSFERYLKYEEITPAEYTREEVIRRLNIGVKALNSSLSDEAIDVWFERGVKELENGKYILSRDYRLNLNTPSQLGFDQLTILWDTIAKSDISLFMLHADNPVAVKIEGITEENGKVVKKSEFINSFAKFRMAMQENANCRFDTVVGDHHFFVNHPAKTAEKLIPFMQGT